MTARAVISLAGDLTEAGAGNICEQLRAAAGRDVELQIDSPGGLLFAATVICCEIEEHAGIVRTVVVGQACSAALIVAAAGDWRLVDRRAGLSIHHPAPRSPEASADVLTALAGYSGQQPAVVRAWLDTERAFAPAEAQALGLVDAIMDDGQRPVLLRQIRKRPPAPWLRPWRTFCEDMDLR